MRLSSLLQYQEFLTIGGEFCRVFYDQNTSTYYHQNITRSRKEKRNCIEILSPSRVSNLLQTECKKVLNSKAEIGVICKHTLPSDIQEDGYTFNLYFPTEGMEVFETDGDIIENSYTEFLGTLCQTHNDTQKLFRVLTRFIETGEPIQAPIGLYDPKGKFGFLVPMLGYVFGSSKFITTDKMLGSSIIHIEYSSQNSFKRQLTMNEYMKRDLATTAGLIFMAGPKAAADGLEMIGISTTSVKEGLVNASDEMLSEGVKWLKKYKGASEYFEPIVENEDELLADKVMGYFYNEQWTELEEAMKEYNVMDYDSRWIHGYVGKPPLYHLVKSIAGEVKADQEMKYLLNNKVKAGIIGSKLLRTPAVWGNHRQARFYGPFESLRKYSDSRPVSEIHIL